MIPPAETRGNISDIGISPDKITTKRFVAPFAAPHISAKCQPHLKYCFKSFRSDFKDITAVNKATAKSAAIINSFLYAP